LARHQNILVFTAAAGRQGELCSMTFFLARASVVFGGVPLLLACGESPNGGNTPSSAGSAMAAGMTSSAGTASNGGTASVGGAFGAGAGSGGTASSVGGQGGLSGGTAGASGSAGAGGGSGVPTTDKFSFFVTSLKAMVELSKSENGFGGDLRFGETGEGAGLRGADKICTAIAEKSMPGNNKTWRAFLSATKGADGQPVHAIDRIGEGLRLTSRLWNASSTFAENLSGLLFAALNVVPRMRSSSFIRSRVRSTSMMPLTEARSTSPRICAASASASRPSMPAASSSACMGSSLLGRDFGLRGDLDSSLRDTALAGGRVAGFA
jgi:hypothetical protein